MVNKIVLHSNMAPRGKESSRVQKDIYLFKCQMMGFLVIVYAVTERRNVEHQFLFGAVYSTTMLKSFTRC